MTSEVTEHTETDQTDQAPHIIASEKKKHRQLIKAREFIIGSIFIVVIAVLGTTLFNKLVLQRDVSNARAVSNQVVADIAKRDGAGIRSLGSPKFQKSYTASSLTQGFQSVQIATLKTPTLVDTIVIGGSDGREVYFIYKYSALKVPFYVRTGIEHRDGHWYLFGISGNIDESQLDGDD